MWTVWNLTGLHVSWLASDHYRRSSRSTCILLSSFWFQRRKFPQSQVVSTFPTRGVTIANSVILLIIWNVIGPNFVPCGTSAVSSTWYLSNELSYGRTTYPSWNNSLPPSPTPKADNFSKAKLWLTRSMPWRRLWRLQFQQCFICLNPSKDDRAGSQDNDWWILLEHFQTGEHPCYLDVLDIQPIWIQIFQQL